MKLLELHIDGFGKFHDRTIAFEDGVNILYGRNEAGKSTIHTFIRGMLFGMERGRGRAARNDLYSRYEPWENSGSYAGWLRLENGGIVYRIERRFKKDERIFRVVNETMGREEEPTKALMDQILSGLNETAYNNTISIGQLKSATEEGMVHELKNYIANMNTTGNLALNITKATAFLKNERRQMEAGLTPEASREYADLLTEIRTVDAEISSPEYENQLAFYQNMREQLKGVIESTQAEKQALVEQVEKGRKFIANGGFSDLESVRKYEKKADSLYASHEALIRETRRKSRRILPGVALLLAVLCAGAAGFLFSAGWAEHKVYLAACVINAAISAALGLWLLGKNRRLLSALEETDAALKELLSRHLGDGTISAEAMKAFQGRMAEFSRLCGIVVRSEGEVRQFMEKIASLQTKQNSCSEMIEKQQRIQWELEKKLEYVNHCKTQARALKRVLVENERINEEIAAVEMAQKVMTDLSFSIRDSFGLYLNKEASEFIREITGGIYDSMSVDENLNVFLNTKTKLAPIESVSSGTMDQVYLALRLAAAKLLAGGKETMPLLFDDSFTQYDDERLSAALKWLAASYGGQMIFFTCHRREADFLRAADVRFHLIEL